MRKQEVIKNVGPADARRTIARLERSIANNPTGAGADENRKKLAYWQAILQSYQAYTKIGK